MWFGRVFVLGALPEHLDDLCGLYGDAGVEVCVASAERAQKAWVALEQRAAAFEVEGVRAWGDEEGLEGGDGVEADAAVLDVDVVVVGGGVARGGGHGSVEHGDVVGRGGQVAQGLKRIEAETQRGLSVIGSGMSGHSHLKVFVWCCQVRLSSRRILTAR